VEVLSVQETPELAGLVALFSGLTLLYFMSASMYRRMSRASG
jgi:hypothetical protein